MVWCLLPNSSAPFADTVAACKSLHMKMITLWFPLCFAVIIMTCWMTHIGVKKNRYTDVTSTWQSCLLMPNYVDIPLSDATGQLAQLYYAITHMTLTDKTLQLAGFINSNCYLGANTILMTFVGQFALYRSWNHVGWILPCGFFGLWCSLIAMTYYTAAPVLPNPTETNSTLLLLLYWLHKKDWTDLNGGDNVCDTAYNFVVVYALFNLMMIAIMGSGTTLAFIAAYRQIHDREYVPIRVPKGGWAIFSLTIITMFTYIGAFIGKMVTSFTALNALRDYSGNDDQEPLDQNTLISYPDIFYPFTAGVINLTSVLWACVFMSVCRGFFNSRLAPYKSCGMAALLYVITNYTAMVYLWTTYYDLNMDKDEVCNHYFNLPENAHTYGYPTYEQSKVYCVGFRMTAFMGLGLFIEMHLFVILSAYTYFVNYDNGDGKAMSFMDETGKLSITSPNDGAKQGLLKF